MLLGMLYDSKKVLLLFCYWALCKLIDTMTHVSYKSFTYFSDEKILRKYWAWKETRTFARHPKQKASWHPIANPEISNSTQQIRRDGLFRWRRRTRSTSHYTAIYFESKHFQHLQNGGQSSVQLSGVLHTYTVKSLLRPAGTNFSKHFLLRVLLEGGY